MLFVQCFGRPKCVQLMNNRFFQFERVFSVQLQATLLIALCLGSVAVLAFDILATRVKPEREREVGDELRSASQRMAEAASAVQVPGGVSNGALERVNKQLAAVTDKVLAEFPDIEGGFYLGGELDRFSGYAFPTRPRPHPPGDSRKTDPPPLEAPYIRLQARDCLEAPAGKARSSVRDVESSRVMIVTEPVGTRRPALVATWVMYRLIDPRSLGNQVRRYQTSTGMAIGGLALAALLLINLGRSLRKQRAREVELRDELRRSEHLAGLGKLLAGVAHEVRNPLAAIRSTVQLWQRLPDTARTETSLDAVIQSVDRLNQTVTQLLYFSRADHADRQDVQINPLLRETLELLAAQAVEQNVTQECHWDERIPALSASPNALRQVFVNLFQNALQAMPTGGCLQIETHWDEQAWLVRIQVSDTGMGVSPEQQTHLFEPFFTTRADGTGLGLALCREIIVQHGGRIEYLSSRSKGATFQITLPALPPRP
jgi:two-component system, NtrC family, sensor histidine kinase HydH